MSNRLISLPSPKAWLIRIAIAIVGSGLILAILFSFIKEQSDQKTFPHLTEVLTNLAMPLLLVYGLMHCLALLLRAFRYRKLLQCGGETHLPTNGQMILVTGCRNMLVDLLPARLGELGYAAILNKVYGVSVASGLTSLGLSIVFNFIALAFILIILATIQAITYQNPGWVLPTIVFGVVISIISVFIFTVCLPAFISLLTRFKKFSLLTNIAQYLILVLQQMDDGIVKVRESGSLILIFFTSIAIRLLKYFSLIFLFFSIAGPNFPELVNVLWSDLFFVLVGAELASSLPAPTLMGFGSYEAGGTMMFSLFNIPLHQGLFALLAVHIWSQVVDYGIGVICFILIIFRHKTAS